MIFMELQNYIWELSVPRVIIWLLQSSDIVLVTEY